MLCKNRWMQVTAVRVDLCFKCGRSLWNGLGSCNTVSLASLSCSLCRWSCSFSTLHTVRVLTPPAHSMGLAEELQYPPRDWDKQVDAGSVFCYPLQAERIRFSSGGLLISLFLSQHADTWGLSFKLVLGLTLDSAWDLSLGSKAGTTLGRCRQLLCFGQATAPPVSLGSLSCPVFSLNEDVSIYRRIGHKNWNFC